jgi:hypothetical protein
MKTASFVLTVRQHERFGVLVRGVYTAIYLRHFVGRATEFFSLGSIP